MESVTQELINSIITSRNTLRSKGNELGICLLTDKLSDIATKFNTQLVKVSMQAEVQEGQSITIPKGWHDGSGTVIGVSGGGSYSLQAKTVTPTKSQQEVTSDEGYYGLSGVTVAPIPDQYQDVSSTTASAANVLLNKVFVAADGTLTTGTMPNIGSVGTQKLTTLTTSYTIAKGYHDGTGKVEITLEEKSATPSTSVQNITPTSGKLLSKVTVNAIPAKYKDSSDVTATAAMILADAVAIGKNGSDEAAQVTGTMVNNGNIATQTLSTSKTSYTVPEGYHAGSGKVQLVLEEKSATPTTSSQNITPTSGKVLSKVTVAAIPSQYKDSTNVNAYAANVLADKKVIGLDADSNITEITGTMTNNGAWTQTIDGLTTTEITIPAGFHSGAGKISLTDDIRSQLAEI